MSVTHIDRINATSGFVCTGHIQRSSFFTLSLVFLSLELHWTELTLYHSRCTAGISRLSLCLMQTCKLRNFSTTTQIFFSILIPLHGMNFTDTHRPEPVMYPTTAHWSNKCRFFASTLITFVYIALHFMSKLSNIAHFSMRFSLGSDGIMKKRSYWELQQRKNQFQRKPFV